MEINEAIEFFRKASETEFKDKDDFINDCVVLFLEGAAPEDCVRKTKSKRIGQAYENQRFVKPIISDEGEDVSDYFYFVDKSSIEMNDGNRLKDEDEARKLVRCVLLSNALVKKPTICLENRFIRWDKGKPRSRKRIWFKNSEHRVFYQFNRCAMANTNKYGNFLSNVKVGVRI